MEKVKTQRTIIINDKIKNAINESSKKRYKMRIKDKIPIY